MSHLIDWFAENRVAANLLMILVVASGLLVARGMRQEPFPNVALDVISVRVSYPGAPPDEIEKAICVRIESAIHAIDGIRRIVSIAAPGFGAITAELALGAQSQRVLDEIKTRVHALDSLPEGADLPIVQELIDDHVLLSVAVYGDAAERTLRRVAERVRDDLARLPNAGEVQLASVRPYEISIEVSGSDLRRHGLSFDDVLRAVRGASLDLPAGSLETHTGEILLRINAQAYHGSEFERLALLTREDGTRLYLGDVARVIDGFEETHVRARFDGESAAIVRLLVGEGRQVIELSRAVRAYLDSSRGGLPEGISLAIWNDDSEALRSRRDLLLKNAAQGLVLVVMILALFMPLRLVFWVSAGLPVALLGAVSVMASLDVSINMMSLLAFIVAIGLVVDDAIIIGESIDRHQRSGADRLRATIAGVREMAVPVVLAALTTVLFLVPILCAPGFIARMARSVPIVVMACLLFSLLESLLVLPAHLSTDASLGWKFGSKTGRAGSRGLQRTINAALDQLVEAAYRPLLERVLRWPQLLGSIALVALMLAIATLGGGWVPFKLLPEVEAETVSAELEMPEGTPAEVTDEAVRYLERHAVGLRDEIDAQEPSAGGSVFEHILASVGAPPDEHDDLLSGDAGSHVGQVGIQLAPGDRRMISSFEVEDRWRRRVGQIPGAIALRFAGSDISNDPPIDILLSSPDPDMLAAAAAALKLRLAAYPGTRELSDTLRSGKQELKLRIRPEAEAFGITPAELARQVRQGFHGEEAQRVQRGRDEVPVVVRYPRGERYSLGDLEQTWIRAPAGRDLPFFAVASAELGFGYSTIHRTDRSRTINVRADVDPAISSAQEILADLRQRTFPQIAADFPGVRLDPAGQNQEEAELVASLARNWLLAMLLGYALLASALRSYTQPVAVVVAIPFGFVGAVIGHAILGLDFSGLSLIGMLALTGVVINDALVYVDAINRMRAGGLSLRDSVVRAGVLRFRPIVLTSLTTFVGLLPLLFERGAQAQWLKPIVATLAFGVVSATAITLLVVPAAYAMLERDADVD